MGSLVKSTEHLRKKLYNLFQKTEAKEILPDSFYQASITQMAKTGGKKNHPKTTYQFPSLTQMRKLSTKYLHIESNNVGKEL